MLFVLFLSQPLAILIILTHPQDIQSFSEIIHHSDAVCGTSASDLNDLIALISCTLHSPMTVHGCVICCARHCHRLHGHQTSTDVLIDSNS